MDQTGHSHLRGTDVSDAVACRTVCAMLRPVARAVATLTGTPLVASVATRRPWVALTVDDGPDRATTPDLLDVLRAHHAQATFFLIGERVARHPHLAAQIAADGHEIGNHLQRDEPSIRLPPAEFARQLTTVHAQLAPLGPVRYFRPGSGWFSIRMLRAAAAHGYRCAMGSPLLIDATYDDPGETGRTLARRAHPGSIVVLHEGTADRAGVAEAADALLTALRERNLRVCTLSTLDVN